MKVEKFVCNLCEKVFDKKGPLSNHRNLVHTLRSKEMPCDFCEDIFQSKKDLCSHISSNHAEYFVKQEPEVLSEAKKESEISIIKLETISKCTKCEAKFYSQSASEEHIRIVHKDKVENNTKLVVKTAEIKEDKVKLNYILDHLKNMKVAKLNARRSMESKRINVNDLNIRFETNSAKYLVCKEELMKLKRGYTEIKNGVKIEVESKMNQVDNVDNNPTTVIKMKITEIKTDFQSKVTLNLYHSNQGFHIQGGRRNGNMTSCSLLADFLEDFFNNIKHTFPERIKSVCDILLGLDLQNKL